MEYFKSVKLVAEIGINHNGDLELAKSLVDEAVKADFDYVKFQKRNVELTTPKSRWNEMKDTPWGRISYLDYKRQLEFDQYEYDEIDNYCRKVGIKWFASPWDVDSVDFLTQYDIPYIKIASACNTDKELLAWILQIVKTPIILSTGMSTWEQFKSVYELFNDQVEFILACTSSYPTPDEDMNLLQIETLYNQFGSECEVGFSNHNPGIFFAACSAALGATMIEVHITKDRSMYGSDQATSIEPSGMKKLSKYVRSLEKAMGDGSWKVFESEQPCIKNLRWKDLI